MEASFRIAVQPLDGTTVVALEGTADLATCDELRTALRACGGDVSVDLSGTTLLDASNIAVLVTEQNRLATANARLRHTAPTGLVRTVLHIVGLAPWIDADRDTTGFRPESGPTSIVRDGAA
jgi:anti-anti-sigma factor